MKKVIVIIILLFVKTKSYAQSSEEILAKDFLNSVRTKNFSLLEKYMGPNKTQIKLKWQNVVDNNTDRSDFEPARIVYKKIITGENIPNLPMKPMLAIYEYGGKEWDDCLLMISTDNKDILLMDIPTTSRMFKLDEEQRGRNIKDLAK